MKSVTFGNMLDSYRQYYRLSSDKCYRGEIWALECMIKDIYSCNSSQFVKKFSKIIQKLNLFFDYIDDENEKNKKKFCDEMKELISNLNIADFSLEEMAGFNNQIVEVISFLDPKQELCSKLGKRALALKNGINVGDIELIDILKARKRYFILQFDMCCKGKIRAYECMIKDMEICEWEEFIKKYSLTVAKLDLLFYQIREDENGLFAKLIQSDAEIRAMIEEFEIGDFSLDDMMGFYRQIDIVMDFLVQQGSTGARQVI